MAPQNKQKYSAAAVAMLIIAIMPAISGCAAAKYPYAEGKNMSIVFFDVGQGDSALAFFPDGAKMLIDCGEFSQAASYIRAMNITRIDLLVISHPDKDHEGGCKYVMETAEVAQVITNRDVSGNFNIELTETAFIEAVVAFDGRERLEGDNDNSLMLKIGYGNISFFFTGDCEYKCENALAENYNLNVDVLKAGHHGSKHSSTKKFLEKASPSSVIVSAGKGNQYSHPNDEALQRMADIGAEVYRTDLMGSIIITTDGSSYSVG